MNKPGNGGNTEENTHHSRKSFGHFLQDKFDLEQDKATEEEVVENINKGVEFAGPNLWILIFATFVASLGLNVNSTAVIIGAMLISPLMGPIMGIGLSLGISDFELMKRSLRNFGFMVAVSIVASTVYFFISPLSHAQSELLARTSPTLYDVLIAFFGGFAGIVAQSRRDRTTTVIPGVAIATALMPPLCTAGFGIANGQWNFIVGGIYLFFINTVFIALATYIIVRFMKYTKKAFLDKGRERRVKNYMMAIIVLTVVPSIFLSYRIVQKSIFENNADRFVSSVFNFRNTQVLDYKTIYNIRKDKSQLDVMLLGEPLTQDVIDNITAQLPHYGLRDTELYIGQSDGSDKIDINTLQHSYSQLLDEKNKTISDMRQQLDRLEFNAVPTAEIAREAHTIVDNIGKISVSRQYVRNSQGTITDTILVCVVVPESASEKVDTGRLETWLEARTQSGRVMIFLQDQ